MYWESRQTSIPKYSDIYMKHQGKHQHSQSYPGVERLDLGSALFCEIHQFISANQHSLKQCFLLSH